MKTPDFAMCRKELQAQLDRTVRELNAINAADAKYKETLRETPEQVHVTHMMDKLHEQQGDHDRIVRGESLEAQLRREKDDQSKLKLKSCPFCGKLPRMFITSCRVEFTCTNDDCEVIVSASANNAEIAAHYWNKRA